MKKMHIGVIIGICLIIYWYMKDHPQITHPAPTQGFYDVVPALAQPVEHG